MAAIDDIDSGAAIDYLGRPQPLASKRLSLTASGGGGSVTAPATPSLGERASALTSGAPGAFSRATAGATPSDLAKAAQAAGVAAKGASLGDKAMAAFAHEPDAPQAPSGQIAPDIPLAEGQPTQFPAGGGTGLTSADAATAAEAEGGAAEAGGSALDFLPAAGAVLKAGLAQPGIIHANLSTGDKLALEANTIGDAIGNAYSLGIPAVIDQVIQLFGGPSQQKFFMDLFGIGGGSYVPKRQKAGREASADLTHLGGAYRTAAQSGDLGQIQQVLGTSDNHVSGSVQVTPALAKTIGAPEGAYVQNLTPEQFTQVLDAYANDPNAVSFSGSGDVPYLPYGSAVQVQQRAIQNARA